MFKIPELSQNTFFNHRLFPLTFSFHLTNTQWPGRGAQSPHTIYLPPSYYPGIQNQHTLAHQQQPSLLLFFCGVLSRLLVSIFCAGLIFFWMGAWPNCLVFRLHLTSIHTQVLWKHGLASPNSSKTSTKPQAFTVAQCWHWTQGDELEPQRNVSWL